MPQKQEETSVSPVATITTATTPNTSGVTTPNPEIKKVETMDKKLSEPVASAQQTTYYKVDPYREQI